MELLLGSHVREHGNRIGRLAGFELEPATHRVMHIIFSEGGDLGSQAMMRPIAAISHVHDGGEIELRADVDDEALATASGMVLLSGSTHVKQADHDYGHLTGIEVNPADQLLMSLFGRSHWWSRKATLEATRFDCSTPGEIRLTS